MANGQAYRILTRIVLHGRIDCNTSPTRRWPVDNGAVRSSMLMDLDLHVLGSNVKVVFLGRTHGPL